MTRRRSSSGTRRRSVEGSPRAIIPVDEAASITVFAMFGCHDPYIGDPARQAFMVNVRVDNLDGVIERLRDVGTVAEPIVEEENGRFSWTVDPQGNRIELWEPDGAG
ncbi:MAG TPA: hypothetical protein VIJ99_02300 [Acidimicrobiales bacterium]